MLNNITYKTAEDLKRVGFPQHIDMSKKPQGITDKQYISQFPPHSPSVEELLHILKGKVGGLTPILQVNNPDFYIWDIDFTDVPNKVKIELYKKYNNEYDYNLGMNRQILNPDNEWDISQVKNPFNIVKRNLGEFLSIIYIDLTNKKIPLTNKYTVKQKSTGVIEDVTRVVDSLRHTLRTSEPDLVGG